MTKLVSEVFRGTLKGNLVRLPCEMLHMEANVSAGLGDGYFNPRPTGIPDFPPPTGGGGGGERPRLSRLLLVADKNEKKS